MTKKLEDYLSSPIKKHSVKIAGHQTSITMEQEFWDQLKISAEEQNIPLSQLITDIDELRTTGLSSACRMYILHRLIEK